MAVIHAGSTSNAPELFTMSTVTGGVFEVDPAWITATGFTY